MSSNASQSYVDPREKFIAICLFGMLIILAAPAIIVGFLGSREILKRVPLEYQRLVWSCIVLCSVACLYIGYRTCWPLFAPGSPLLPLLADVRYGFHHNLLFHNVQLLHDIIPVWFRELLLAPAAIVFCALREQTREKNVAQIVRERQLLLFAQRRNAIKAAERVLAKPIPDAVLTKQEPPAIILGVPIEGTLTWIKHQLFYLPFDFLIRHAVVIGASGSGKSETLLRIAYTVAKALRWQIIYVDAKGDYKAAAKFLLAMQAAGLSNIHMFPVERYNGWNGSRDALLSRLLAIDNVADVTSAGQHHYATVRENLVEMCINAPGGPPTSSKELLERLMLTNGKLYDLYDGYAELQSYLSTLLERPQEALSAYGHYRAFFSKAHGMLDGTWSFDDCEAAYVLLDGLALPEIADSLGRFLLADFVNYTTRKDWNKRTMFIFDEVGSLNLPLFNLFEKVRFRNVSVVVSSQDPSGLARKPGGIGTWDEVRRVLGNAAVKIVHRCEDAHEVIKRAGTNLVAEENYRTNENGATTGGGTTSLREEPKIDYNDVLQLEAGNAYVIGSGNFERVRVAMLSVDEARWQQLYRELERQSKEEPPPLQRRGYGARVVNSTLATGSSNGGTSGTQKPGLSSPPSAAKPQGQNGSRQGNAVQKPVGKAASSAALINVPNVSETAMLPEDANAPTRPGVLPMWDREGEDLLP